MWIESRLIRSIDPDKFIGGLNDHLDNQKRNDVLITQNLMRGDILMMLRVHSDISNFVSNIEEVREDWKNGLKEKLGEIEFQDISLSNLIASNDPNGKLDGKLEYYHAVSGTTYGNGGDYKAAAMFQKFVESIGPALLDKGVRMFGLNPITGIPINRFMMVRGFTTAKVVEENLAVWNDPSEPTQSTYSSIWQDQFRGAEWRGGLFKTVRQLIHL